jgi:hypothetical protein
VADACCTHQQRRPAGWAARRATPLPLTVIYTSSYISNDACIGFPSSSDPTRRRVPDTLRHGERPVNDIVSELVYSSAGSIPASADTAQRRIRRCSCRRPTSLVLAASGAVSSDRDMALVSARSRTGAWSVSVQRRMRPSARLTSLIGKSDDPATCPRSRGVATLPIIHLDATAKATVVPNQTLWHRE